MGEPNFRCHERQHWKPVSDRQQKNRWILPYRSFLFAMYWIATFCSTCLFCLIDPFISFVFGPAMVLDRPIVEICILNFFLMTMRIPFGIWSAPPELFKRTSIFPSLEHPSTSSCRLYSGSHLGMLGIFIGTTCTYATQFLLKTILFYHCFLQKVLCNIS